MSFPKICLLMVCGLLWAAPRVDGAPPGNNDAQATSAQIDRAIAQRWAVDKLKPAPAADDAEFLRRIYLDLAGRVPSVMEVRAFLKDGAPDKRQRLIEKLLAGQRYVTHFTTVWQSWMIPESNANIQARIALPGFTAWLSNALSNNMAYDEMVREILTAPVAGAAAPRVAINQNESSPSAFYVAKELKPENIAASTSRLFLGVRLECAQCHNHPFADWKRDQFWGYTAFFAGIQARNRGDFPQPREENTAKKEITIPGTERVVQAAFLDGSKPKFKTSPRETLADWMTAPNNPYFARAAVNRMWGYFFGTGLIDPVDEMVGADNVASHPELLNLLAKEFVAHEFDLKFLIQAITGSKAYQLSSAGADKRLDDPRLFARMAIKGLSAEQLFDSVSQAVGYPIEEAPTGNVRAVFIGANNSVRGEFVNKFTNQNEKSTETQTSILQALALMNGRFVGDATNLDRSETLAAVADAPFMDTASRVETLYLAALARKPKAKELSRMVSFIEKKSDAKQRKQALADVFWVLLNSGEFILNH